MSDRQPYSRVYWSIRTDPKFVDVYGDDRHLATWLRLLIAAEATWPAPADVPASARKASLAALSEAQLIDLLPGGMFQMHGLDAERKRRADAARTGANIRYDRTANGMQTQPKRDANRMQTGPEPDANGLLVLEDEPIGLEDEPIGRAETPRPPDPADVYWTLTGRYPTDKVLGWVDDLSASYGPEAVIRALATSHSQDRTTSTFLGRTQDALRAEARALSLKEQASVRTSIKERRAAPRPDIDQEALAAEIRRLMEPGAAA